MQTFLPIADFSKSAELLDTKRLGKQRLEVKQILNTLRNGGGGWANHPACKMWAGYEAALENYGYYCVLEWTTVRRFKNTLEFTFRPGSPLPLWFGDEAFHASHRSNLLRKDPAFYGRYGWTESPDLPYVWP